MFSWLEGLVSSIASSIGGVFEGIGDTIVNAIWDNLVKWLFNAFYDSIADVFSQMGDMGAEISTSLGLSPPSTCFSSSAGFCLAWASLWRLSTWLSSIKMAGPPSSPPC